MTNICVCNLNIIGSDNGLSTVQRQAIIWINAGILLIWPLGTNMHLKMSSARCWPFCLLLSVLRSCCTACLPGQASGCVLAPSPSLGLTCLVITLRPKQKWPTRCRQHFSNTFPWMKAVVFWFQFHWSSCRSNPINSDKESIQFMVWLRTGRGSQIIVVYIFNPRSQWVSG